ncbi:MAG: ABC transporter permease [Clostridiales bacterium]|nr:ABC transporter permease [Clostridiales bacterium]MDR2752659.1 ABC transporter permease [Clostridiales bacterium]
MLLENLGLAIESLRANKMRSILTMLGIIIGIASVTAIISIGNALSSQVTSEMGSFGATNIYVMLQAKNPENETVYQMQDNDLLSEELITNFQQTFSDRVKGIALSQQGEGGTAKEGRKSSTVSVLGVNSQFGIVNNIKLVKGRFINEKDNAGRKNVGVVSEKLSSKLFGRSDPLGREAKVYTKQGVATYTVVGVYKSEESPSMLSTGSTESTAIYIPVSTANLAAGAQGYSNFTVMGLDGKVQQLKESMDSFFASSYKNDIWEANSMTMESQLKSMMNMLGSVSMAIGAIAGISLLVGGVGVMNIMMVSVTERTREIGARKALGAKKFHIRSQFVIEAMLLSLAGGLIGIVLGVIISSVASVLLGAKASLDLPVIAACVIFSMAIGVFFGYYPASKASSLDPIEALRYE